MVLTPAELFLEQNADLIRPTDLDGWEFTRSFEEKYQNLIDSRIRYLTSHRSHENDFSEQKAREMISCGSMIFHYLDDNRLLPLLEEYCSSNHFYYQTYYQAYIYLIFGKGLSDDNISCWINRISVDLICRYTRSSRIIKYLIEYRLSEIDWTALSDNIHLDIEIFENNFDDLRMSRVCRNRSIPEWFLIKITPD